MPAYQRQPFPGQYKERRVYRTYPLNGIFVCDEGDKFKKTHLVWPDIVQYEHIETKALMSFPRYLPWRLVVRDNFKYFYLFSHGWLTSILHTGMEDRLFINDWHRSQHLHYMLSQEENFLEYSRRAKDIDFSVDNNED